jgi:hypothetical protein
MANEQNLIPGGHKLTVEEASRGGKASGKARREKKAFAELINSVLNERGGTLNGTPATKKQIIAARAVQILLQEEVDDRVFLEAFKTLRDTIGERPQESINVSAGKPDELTELLESLRGGDESRE